jgi:HAD superfamily hydrolase (TIGR01509 family)
MPLHEIWAVLFDLDGLMLDSEPVYRAAWQEAARDLGYGISDELYLGLLGRTNEDGEAILVETFGAGFPVVRFRERWARLWRDRIRRNGVTTKPGLTELLGFLDARGIPKVVATSSAREDALLGLGALAGRFDAIVSGEEVRAGKPFPDIFLEAAARVRVPPTRCLVLEDSEAGVTAAYAAGTTVIMVPDLTLPSAEAAACVYRVCTSLLEVRDLLAT